MKQKSKLDKISSYYYIEKDDYEQECTIEVQTESYNNFYRSVNSFEIILFGIIFFLIAFMFSAPITLIFCEIFNIKEENMGNVFLASYFSVIALFFYKSSKF